MLRASGGSGALGDSLEDCGDKCQHHLEDGNAPAYAVCYWACVAKGGPIVPTKNESSPAEGGSSYQRSWRDHWRVIAPKGRRPAAIERRASLIQGPKVTWSK